MSIATKIDLQDIRVQDKYSYLNNVEGESLSTFMVRVDDALRASSPDAMSPGIINWGRKDLFTDYFECFGGNLMVTYNPVGQSKIGTGRYEVSGTGRILFKKFVPVSEVRGITSRIYIGAMQAASTVSVGVMCYDANKVELGNNGGHLLNNETVPMNSWSFKKASCFGEANTGNRKFKPNTRYVKLWIEIHNNPGVIYFDESELTVFEQDERYLEISTNEVNWNVSEFFHKAISSDTTFVFTNDQDGKAKVLSVKNISSNAINVYFPTMKWQGGQAFSLINPGSTTVFTFIKMNGTVYASAIEEILLMFPYAYYKEHYTKPIICTELSTQLLKITSNIFTIDGSNVIDLGYKSVGNIDTSNASITINAASNFTEGSFVLITKKSSANQLTIKHGQSFFLAAGKDLVIKAGRIASVFFYATSINGTLSLVEISDSFGPVNPVEEVITYNKNPAIPTVVMASGIVDIDWSASANYYKAISANTTFTFSNALDGQQITVIVAADAIARTVAFPSVKWKDASAQGTSVAAGKQNLYSFIKINGNIYATCIEGF